MDILARDDDVYREFFEKRGARLRWCRFECDKRANDAATTILSGGYLAFCPNLEVADDDFRDEFVGKSLPFNPRTSNHELEVPTVSNKPFGRLVGGGTPGMGSPKNILGAHCIRSSR